LYIGTGGLLNSRTGVNPVDPLEFESNGSYNGISCTFIGIGAGDSNTTGNLNVFVGDEAGLSNVNGDLRPPLVRLRYAHCRHDGQRKEHVRLPLPGERPGGVPFHL
jgi:hypothetical protein